MPLSKNEMTNDITAAKIRMSTNLSDKPSFIFSQIDSFSYSCISLGPYYLSNSLAWSSVNPLKLVWNCVKIYSWVKL